MTDQGSHLPASLLSSIQSPEQLRALPPEALATLAAEIRDFLVEKVSRTGGHLGPSLGVVELTLAIHRVFDSPRDRILFDTGHQAYAHKIVTGRQAGFDQLRQRGGLSGYPSQEESEHDLVENSHASTALSYADGLAKAFAVRGEDRHVVAVVGDGALTGGMCWEAMNNIASGKDRPVVIVVNDNGRSYSPTIGGLADHLASLRLNPGYERVLDTVKEVLGHTPLVGAPLYDALHGIKRGLKDAIAPQGLFEDLGLKYVGPVDGHDSDALEVALRRAKAFGGPVIVHAVTRKGFGYAPAEDDEADCLHSPGAFDPLTGKAHAKPGLKWTSVFADELVSICDERADVVGITAAMAGPTGIEKLARKYPAAHLRRGHRRAARGHLGRRAGHGRPAPGGGRLRDVPEPRVRPDPARRGAAQAARHVRARPGRDHRPRRPEPLRRLGLLDPRRRAGHAGRGSA